MSRRLTGGTGDDTVTLGAAVSGVIVDLEAGNNVLTLANGTNYVTVSNVETLTGGTGDDHVTLGAGITGADITLGTGNNSLTRE